jgi:hypothetical protein
VPTKASNEVNKFWYLLKGKTIQLMKLCPVTYQTMQLNYFSGSGSLAVSFAKALIMNTAPDSDGTELLHVYSQPDAVLSKSNITLDAAIATTTRQIILLYVLSSNASVVYWSEFLATERRCIVLPVLNLCMLCRRK